MADEKKKAEELKKSLKDISEITGTLEEGFRELTSRLSDTVDELKDATGELKSFDLIHKDILRASRTFGKTLEDQIKNQAKLNSGTLSSKEIHSQINKKHAEEEILISRINQLKSRANSSELISEEEKENLLLKIEKDQQNLNELSQQSIVLLEKQFESAKKLEETLGTSGALVKGANRIPFLRDLPGMSTLMGDITAEVNLQNKLKAKALGLDEAQISKTQALGITFNKLGGVIKNSLTDPLILGGVLLGQFWSALKSSDKATGDLAKSFNITYEHASDVRETLVQIGFASGNAAVTAIKLQESMIAIGQALGTNAQLNADDLVTFTELREQAGYTNEELVGIQKLTLVTGGNLKDNTKQFLGTVAALNGQNKLLVNEKQLLKEVSNTSAAIKLSIGGTTEKLAEAAFKAKQFGINLEQADKISESLLNFEQSISNQVSAEIITGKQLNLEKARLLALNNDIAGASAEVLSQVGNSATFTKMNRIQAEALAKAVGMTRDELAKSLVEREALQKIGMQDKTGLEAYNELKKQGLSQDEIAIRLGDKKYADTLKQQSVQEQLTNTVEKMKEALIPVAQIILPKINSMMEFINKHSTALLITVGAIGSIISINILGGLLKSTVQMVSLIAKSSILLGQYIAMAAAWAIANPIGAAIGLGLAAGVGALVYSQIKDGMISPRGGLVVSGEKGTYQLDPNDHVIAGTDLNKKQKSTSPKFDLSPLLEEIKALRQEHSKSNLKPIMVENSINGTHFGTAVAINTYKIQ